VLPESLPLAKRAPFLWSKANPVGALKLLRSHPQLSGLAIVEFLGNLAHASLPTISVLYMMYRYGWDERTVGFTMAGVGLCSMIVQGALIGPTIKRLGERNTLLVGLAFGVAGFVMFGLAASGPVFWAAIPLMALWGLANPSAMGLMSRLVGSSEQGQLQGANASLMGIASLFGPVLFTQAFAFFIAAGSLWHLPGAPYLLAAMLLAFAIIIAWRTTVTASQ
jgi:DHA1 family tetracycline resistance protein-like MFS transporter